MNGIYPDYVGPTSEYRKVSLFPDWVGYLGGIIPTPPEGWLGGVVVLPNVLGTAIVGGTLAGIAQLARAAAIIWPSSQGVMSRLSALGGLDATTKPAADPTIAKLGVTPVDKPGVELITKESGHE